MNNNFLCKGVSIYGYINPYNGHFWIRRRSSKRATLLNKVEISRNATEYTFS